MSSEGIFIETPDGLRLLRQAPYESEDVLQSALEDYPEVMAGIRTSADEPARLVLVQREAAVPSQEGGSRVWSLDHLFVDSEAVPVLVEVKRSSDTRIRREVVGQMLDYAANGLKYWPLDELRSALESRIPEDTEIGDWMASALDVEDVDDYWRQVEANLRAGRVRLVFVADELPTELVRIIEFLNEQMSETDVIGVELRQFVDGPDRRAFVPSVVGRTARALQTKSSGTQGQQWDFESFMDAATERRTSAEVELIQRLLQHVKDKGGSYSWGRGVTPGMSGWYPIDGTPRAVFNLNVNDANRRAYLVFWVSDLAKVFGPDRVECLLNGLEDVDAYAEGVTAARSANYSRQPSAFLPDLVTNQSDGGKILGAIDQLLMGSAKL